MRVKLYGITTEQWEQLCGFFDGKCPKCGKARKMSVDHIVPVSQGGKHYDIRNLQPLCLTCNKQKRFDDTDYRPEHVKDWAEVEYLNQGEIRDAPTPPRPICARFTPEWAARIDLMAALDVEMPDGVTSVLQEGAEMAWAKYGRLAEVMADAKARAREEHDR